MRCFPRVSPILFLEEAEGGTTEREIDASCTVCFSPQDRNFVLKTVDLITLVDACRKRNGNQLNQRENEADMKVMNVPTLFPLKVHYCPTYNHRWTDTVSLLEK